MARFLPGTVRKISSGEVAIQTGDGLVYPDLIGDVILKVMGSDKITQSLRLRGVLHIKKLLVKIICGEQFCRSRSSVQGNRLVDKNGRMISLINVERRGLYIWLHKGTKLLKAVGST